MCQQELVNSLNQFYVSVNTDIPPLDSNILPAFLPAEAGVLTVQPHEVCKKLLDIIHNVPCRIVYKEFTYDLAEPITTIFNTSLRSGIVPVVWKESNIIPIPKIQSPMAYLVTWLMDDVKDKIVSRPTRKTSPPLLS